MEVPTNLTCFTEMCTRKSKALSRMRSVSTWTSLIRIHMAVTAHIEILIYLHIMHLYSSDVNAYIH